MRIVTSGSVNARNPSSCKSRLPAGEGYGVAATIGVAQEEEEEGMDQQDIFDRVVSFLAALTRLLCNRVLGADDASFRPVMGNKEDAGATAGTATSGAAASSSGTTRVTAAASATPSRWAKAISERAGASPRARSAARSAGKRRGIHRWALRCTILNKRPCTTWSVYVFRETRINKSRSSGVGRGLFWYTVNRRAVRGFPSIRHVALLAWKAVSKGGPSC
jgi:hypothetical protein